MNNYNNKQYNNEGSKNQLRPSQSTPSNLGSWQTKNTQATVSSCTRGIRDMTIHESKYETNMSHEKKRTNGQTLSDVEDALLIDALKQHEKRHKKN
jgi:hypothetical protein